MAQRTSLPNWFSQHGDQFYRLKPALWNILWELSVTVLNMSVPKMRNGFGKYWLWDSSLQGCVFWSYESEILYKKMKNTNEQHCLRLGDSVDGEEEGSRIRTQRLMGSIGTFSSESLGSLGRGPNWREKLNREDARNSKKRTIVTNTWGCLDWHEGLCEERKERLRDFGVRRQVQGAGENFPGITVRMS